MTNGKWLAIVLLIGLLLAPPALAGDKTLVVGTRIPQLYFTTTGSGQTDLGSGHDPWETGSYDLALLKAGIENFNIMEYSSVLPPESKEISQQEAKKYYHHGAVLETIMANVNGRQGDQLCAGVGRIQVRRKADGKHIGGFAAEYEGHASAAQAKEILHQSLLGIFNRRYSPTEYEYFDEKFTIEAFTVTKKWGTVLAALSFVSYIHPVLDRN